MPAIFDKKDPIPRFNFLQLHWHWGSNSSQGSEHTLNGKEFPIEIHLVHVNTKYLDENGAPTNDNLVQPDGLAVLGVFYEISEEDNAGLTDVLAKVIIIMEALLTNIMGGRDKNLVQGERRGRGGG